VQPLQELIQYLESEKDTLTRLIDESLAEHDYLSVHHHSQALYRVNNQLKTLYNIEVPAYDKILFAEQFIQSLKKHITRLPDGEILSDRLEDLRQKEEKLASLERSKHRFIDAQQIDECLYGLISGEVHRFSLHLKKKENLFLSFTLLDNRALKIAFGAFEENGIDYFLRSLPAKLKAIGFSADEHSNTFSIARPLNSSAHILGVKEFLARVVFDCFYFKELDNPASLEIEWADR
jgi:hypothetical protein